MVYLIFLLTYISCILCWLIPFLIVPLGFYLGLVYAALFGQTFRESLESQAVEPPAEPAEVAAPAKPAEPAIPAQPDQPEAPAGSAANEVPQA
jgi:hypothetical protein